MRVSSLILPSLLSLSWIACDNDDAGVAESTEPQRSVKKPPKLADVKIPNQIKTIPANNDLKFEEGACLLWNRPELVRDARQPARANRRRTGRDTRRTVDIKPVQELEHTVTTETITPLLAAQLRETLIYFSGQQRAVVEKMSMEKLFDESEDPIFSVVLDKKDGALYTRINIAQGDNPMDLVFVYGSLKPVAVAQDDSLAFCAPSLLAAP